MSLVLTKWPVAQEHVVTDADLGDGGVVSDEAVERWVADAREEYLGRCEILRRVSEQGGFAIGHRVGALPSGARLGKPDSVLVTASASEVRPSSFTVAVRLRSDADTAVNAVSVIRLEDPETGEVQPLGTEIRDELIAIERSAQHYN